MKNILQLASNAKIQMELLSKLALNRDYQNLKYLMSTPVSSYRLLNLRPLMDNSFKSIFLKMQIRATQKHFKCQNSHLICNSNLMIQAAVMGRKLINIKLLILNFVHLMTQKKIKNFIIKQSSLEWDVIIAYVKYLMLDKMNFQRSLPQIV